MTLLTEDRAAAPAPIAPELAGKVPTTWWQWWPLLMGPAGMAFTLTAHAAAKPHLYAKPTHEVIAIVLTSLAVLAALTKLALVRHRFCLLLSLLCMCVLLREIHWDWTTKFIYISVAALAAWAVAWRRDLFPLVDARPQLRIWLISTAATYVLSQFIARKGFQYTLFFLPGVAGLFGQTYDNMEEVVENVGHAMLLVTVLLPPWKAVTRPGRARAPLGDNGPITP